MKTSRNATSTLRNGESYRKRCGMTRPPLRLEYPTGTTLRWQVRRVHRPHATGRQPTLATPLPPWRVYPSQRQTSMQEKGHGKIGGRKTFACGTLGSAPRETEGSSELPCNAYMMPPHRRIRQGLSFLAQGTRCCEALALRLPDPAGAVGRTGTGLARIGGLLPGGNEPLLSEAASG